jgi:hypothetical protein
MTDESNRTTPVLPAGRQGRQARCRPAPMGAPMNRRSPSSPRSCSGCCLWPSGDDDGDTRRGPDPAATAPPRWRRHGIADVTSPAHRSGVHDTAAPMRPIRPPRPTPPRVTESARRRPVAAAVPCEAGRGGASPTRSTGRPSCDTSTRGRTPTRRRTRCRAWRRSTATTAAPPRPGSPPTRSAWVVYQAQGRRRDHPVHRRRRGGRRHERRPAGHRRARSRTMFEAFAEMYGRTVEFVYYTATGLANDSGGGSRRRCGDRRARAVRRVGEPRRSPAGPFAEELAAREVMCLCTGGGDAAFVAERAPYLVTLDPEHDAGTRPPGGVHRQAARTARPPSTRATSPTCRAGSRSCTSRPTTCRPRVRRQLADAVS